MARYVMLPTRRWYVTVMSTSGMLGQALGEHGGRLLGLCDKGTDDGAQSFMPQSSSNSMIRSDWDSRMVLLGRSRMIRWPRYRELIIGPRQTKSIFLDISATNQLYSGMELVMARPSST